MDTLTKILIGYVIFACTFLPSSYYFVEFAPHQAQVQRTDNMVMLLQFKGYTVVDATFSSPEINIVCHSINELMQGAETYNTTTVYRNLQDLYVIDDNANFAYKYTP